MGYILFCGELPVKVTADCAQPFISVEQNLFLNLTVNFQLQNYIITVEEK